MNDKINQLLAQTGALEAELRTAVHSQESRVFFRSRASASGLKSRPATRTEQYFCPIQHAHKILGTHARCNRFLEYGEAEAYEAKPEQFRVALGKVK